MAILDSSDPGSGATPAYLVSAGTLVLVGKQPDGDSVRFRPSDAAQLRQLRNGRRLKIYPDGSVQLRFDGVDAPELHYLGRRQPFSAPPRDVLLERLGLTSVRYAPDGVTVTAAEPVAVPAVILARLVETNGRPVSFVVTGDQATELAPRSGTWLPLTPERLTATANHWLLLAGHAYPLLYSSMPAPLRAACRTAAETAAAGKLGVHALDSSARFPVSGHAALGPDGALIHPKLFRRAVEYLNALARGPVGTLPDWLNSHPDTKDDQLRVNGAPPQRLHTLLTQENSTVTCETDLLSLVFVER